jgi:hypothetical protein
MFLKATAATGFPDPVLGAEEDTEAARHGAFLFAGRRVSEVEVIEVRSDALQKRAVAPARKAWGTLRSCRRGPFSTSPVFRTFGEFAT